MTNPTKFRVQAGALLFEMEGEQEFVQQQLELHHDHIETILAEQAKLIKSGKIPASAMGRSRRGRPAKRARTADASRRPGRQPVIIRESSLELKPRQLGKMDKFLASLADGGRLGKDATVFAIAYFLCKEVLGKDIFTAGDVNASLSQLGEKSFLPAAESVDVVQMLRNLAATSIGKEWVDRNADGTFSLTSKGSEVGASGSIIRPRGRRPAVAAAPAADKKSVAKAVAPKKVGRPRKNAPGKEKAASQAPRRGRGRKAAK